MQCIRGEDQDQNLLILVGPYAGFSGLLLHVVQFLLSGGERLFLAINLFLLLAAVFREFALIAKLSSSVAIIGCGTQTLFPLGHIQLSLQAGDLFLLVFYLSSQLVVI